MTLKTSQYANMNEAVQAAISQRRDLHIDGTTTAIAPIRHENIPNLTIWGKGNDSFVRCGFDSGDIFHFGSVHHENENLLLEDFVIDSTDARDKNISATGYALRLDKCVRKTINNVDIGGRSLWRHARGMWFNGYDDDHLDDCNIYARQECCTINGFPDQSYGADIHLGGGNKFVNFKQSNQSDYERGSVGLRFAGGQGGAYLSTQHTIYCGIGILVDKSQAGVLNREIFMSPTTIVDSCVEDGIRVMADSCGTLALNGVWSASNGLCGLRVQPDQPALELIMTGGTYFNNGEDGVGINGGYVAGSGVDIRHNKGYGLHIANSAVRGGMEPLFAHHNTKGPFRRVPTAAQFAIRHIG